MKKFKNLLQFTIFIGLTIYLLYVAGFIIAPKGTDYDDQGGSYTVNGLYQLKKNQLDILFLGDSSMSRSVSPMQIYEETGITSYNYSINSSRVYMSYYLLKDALITQKPKVVFFDTITLFYEYREKEEEQRPSFDYMRWSKEKVNVVNDKLFSENYFDKISFIFPVLRYHDRWQHLGMKDIKPYFSSRNSISRGFYLSSKYKPNKKAKTYMDKNDKEVHMLKETEEYLYKLIDLCKEEDIDLIFLGIPDTKVWNYSSSKKMEEIAKETDTVFLDLNDSKKYKYDWDTDSENGSTHFNIYGAKKTTEYVTDYILDNYHFKSHKDDSYYDNWNKDLKKYKKKEKATIEKLEYNIDHKIMYKSKNKKK